MRGSYKRRRKRLPLTLTLSPQKSGERGSLRRGPHAAYTLSPSNRSALPWASFARSVGDSDSDFRKAWPRALGA